MTISTISIDVPILIHAGSVIYENKGYFLLACLLGYYLPLYIYRLWFHPLAQFPGPKLAAISDVWLAWVMVSGRSVEIVKNMHMKYGPIIRTSPNDLSFATPTSLKDIYGSTANRKIFPKTIFYDTISMGFENAGVATERDPVAHARKRKLLSPAFSAHAMKSFEYIIHRHLDKLLKEVEERGKTPEGIDMELWFSLIAFDVIGDLAFGESFGALDEGKPHPWMSMILDNINIATFAEAARRFPWFNKLMMQMVPKKVRDAQAKHIEWSKKQIHRRVFAPAQPDQRDMLSFILDQQEAKGISHDEVTAHAAHIIIGGGETLATFLTSTLYQLIRNPRVMQKLCEEIRGKFSDLSQIVESEVRELTYLNAVIKEGLRLFPPAAVSLPRYSPGEYVDGIFIPEGTVVTSHFWTLCRSNLYFKDPEVLIPERWLDQDCTDTLEASQPFSLGTRQCIARHLAHNEIRLYYSKLLFLFDFELVDRDYDWEKGCKALMLWVKPPLRVKVRRREGI